MKEFFVTVTRKGCAPMTLSREANTEHDLQSKLVKEFGQGVSFQWSEPCAPDHFTDAEADIRRLVLESMDLPDGAYFAMAEEMGIGF